MNKNNSKRLIDWYFANGGKENGFLKIPQDPFLSLIIEIGQNNVFVGYWDESEDLIPETVVSWNSQTMKARIWIGPRYPNDENGFVNRFVEQVLERLGQTDQIVQLSENLLVA